MLLSSPLKRYNSASVRVQLRRVVTGDWADLCYETGENFLAFKIGTDEAGYGPNLGPLVVTGTLWESEDCTDDLYQLLAPCVADQPPGRNNPDKQSIAIADFESCLSC